MVRSRFSALKPVVFRLAAALEKYQADFDVLVRTRFDPGLCRAVIRELGEIQNLSAALPQLAADMLEVITRHVELLGLLLRRGGAGAEPVGAAEIGSLRSAHRSTVDAMHGKCLRLLTSDA